MTGTKGERRRPPEQAPSVKVFSGERPAQKRQQAAALHIGEANEAMAILADRCVGGKRSDRRGAEGAEGGESQAVRGRRRKNSWPGGWFRARRELNGPGKS